MWDFRKINIYLCLFVLFISCKQTTKIGIIKAEDFFNDPQKSSFQISPDGKNLSYFKPYNGKLNIFVQSLERNEVTQITSYTDQSIKSYFWAGQQKIFYLKDKDGSGHYQLYSVNKDGSQINQLQTSPQTRIEVIDQVKKNNNFILIAMNERVPEYFDLYKLDINSGKKTLIAKNPGNIIKWISDNDGNVKVAVGSDGLNETLYYRENEKVDFKPVFSNNFRSTLDPLGFTGQKGHIYALSNINRDKLALVDFNCSSGKEVKVIYENPNADILDIMYSKSSNKLAYLTYEISKREIYFLDDKIKRMYDNVRAELQGQEVKIMDSDQDESRFIIKTYSDKDPGAYYLYQLKDKKLSKLADLNPNIKVDEMCEMRSVTYKNRVGITIHGYLTIPLGKEAKNLPCVVIPHSGPANRNIWGYSPEVQFLANRGYAVFQMNYRGSTGYGKDFQTAGHKQWGLAIQDDITDGVKWLINEKIINPNKIGIYGYSFGGYSAINQVIYHPDLYKCAASYSGFINLFNYIKGFPTYYKPYQQMLNEMIGNPELDADYLKYSSPVFQVDKIKTPLLIAQGGKDSRVNVNETNQFVKELKKRNNTVEYILNDSEGHYFRDPVHKLAFYKALDVFLNNNLHPE